MAGAEFDALKADIKANGLRQPIVTHQGMILDGGNRYEACMAVGVKPLMIEYTGENLVTYVLSANFFRRHLSPGQQAAIVASAQDWVKAQAHGGSRKSGQSATLHFDSVQDRAAQSGASVRTQKMADKVAKESPDLAVQVAHGEISLPKAVEKVSKPGKPRKPRKTGGKKDKPDLKVVAPDSDPDVPPEERYTELDAARDQIQDLQAELAAASMGDVSAEAKDMATNLIAELRAENKTLRLTIKAITQSRDQFQNENAALRSQIQRQRREIDRATGRKTA